MEPLISTKFDFIPQDEKLNNSYGIGINPCIPVMEYFSQDEQQKMLEKFWEFDRTMIHEKYKKTVEELEKTIQL